MSECEEGIDPRKLDVMIGTAKAVAREFRDLTGRPLGITGEVGEYEACRLLGLRLADVRQAGYDATRGSGRDRRTYQIKARCLLPGAKPGQRIGRIQLDKEWDAVLLVLLDENFEPTAIYEADRAAVERALLAPGSKSRNERGALPVSKFKSIAGRPVWSKE